MILFQDKHFKTHISRYRHTFQDPNCKTHKNSPTDPPTTPRQHVGPYRFMSTQALMSEQTSWQRPQLRVPSASIRLRQMEPGQAGVILPLRCNNAHMVKSDCCADKCVSPRIGRFCSPSDLRLPMNSQCQGARKQLGHLQHVRVRLH